MPLEVCDNIQQRQNKNGHETCMNDRSSRVLSHVAFVRDRYEHDHLIFSVLSVDFSIFIYLYFFFLVKDAHINGLDSKLEIFWLLAL